MKNFQKIILISSLLIVLSGCSANTELSKNNTDSMMDHSMMNHASMEITSEKEFIEKMIPHHQEAVESSQLLLAKTTNPDLTQFLNGVITLQNKEIQNMQAWYKEWYGTDVVPFAGYEKMMSDFEASTPEEAEQMYIKDMIGHHMGAIQMANDLLALDPTRPELLEFAEGIIRVQADEITKLQSWLKK
jgi:uncharacterized protein (DUF305 family)